MEVINSHQGPPKFKQNCIASAIGEPMVIMPVVAFIFGASYKMVVMADQVKHSRANANVTNCNVANIDKSSAVFLAMSLTCGICGVLLVMGATSNLSSGRWLGGGCAGRDETVRDRLRPEARDTGFDGARYLSWDGICSSAKYVREGTRKVIFEVLSTPEDRQKIKNRPPSAAEIFDVGSKNGMVRSLFSSCLAANFMDCFTQFIVKLNPPIHARPACSTQGYPNPVSVALTLIFFTLFVGSTIYTICDDRRLQRMQGT